MRVIVLIVLSAVLSSLGCVSRTECIGGGMAPPAAAGVATGPAPTTSIAAADLVGTWRRELPDGTTHQVVLFDSGVVGFQHFGEMPISRAFGTWSLVDAELRFEIAGHEPDESPFPLPPIVRVRRADDGLTIDVGGDAVTWTAKPSPYGSGTGADERRARDERGWASLVERARS